MWNYHLRKTVIEIAFGRIIKKRFLVSILTLMGALIVSGLSFEAKPDGWQRCFNEFTSRKSSHYMRAQRDAVSASDDNNETKRSA